MLAGFHALLPASGCLIADNLSLASGREHVFPRHTAWLVAVFGVLPDVCCPHISLEARCASWSHTVWFMAGLVGIVAMVSMYFEKGYRLRVALVCWVASALHLAADAISGGIAWLYPWRNDVIGSSYIPPDDWMWYDAGFILFTWFLVRVLPHLEARCIRRASRPDNS